MKKRIHWSYDDRHVVRFDLTVPVNLAIIAAIKEWEGVDKVSDNLRYGLMVTIGRCFKCQPIIDRIIEYIKSDIFKSGDVEVSDVNNIDALSRAAVES